MKVAFVTMDQKRITYHQVMAYVRDKKPEADYDGIRCINAREWLMRNTK